MATIFQDTFTEGTTNVELTLHTPDTGSSWTKAWQTDSQNFFAFSASDNCGCDSNHGNKGVIYIANATYSTADYEVSVTPTIGYLSTGRMYLIARYQDVENMYALRFTTNATATRMYKKVAGTWTALGSFAKDPPTGTVVTFRVVGNTLSYYYGATLIDTQSASDITAAGKAGFGAGGGAELAASTDDIAAASKHDDFLVSSIESVTIRPFYRFGGSIWEQVNLYRYGGSLWSGASPMYYYSGSQWNQIAVSA